jgi:hypothetical protein
MNQLNILLLIVFLGLVGVMSYKSTLGFLSDIESSTNNNFTAAASYISTTPAVLDATPSPTPTATPPSIILLINEVSSGGANSADWVEIYNPNGAPVDISDWKIADAASQDIIPTTPPIPADGYGVIVTNNTTVAGIPISAITITLESAAIGSGLNVDGDLIRLFSPADILVDQMSYGSNSTAFLLPPSAPTATQSAARSPNGADTDTAAEWIIDETQSIGVAN